MNTQPVGDHDFEEGDQTRLVLESAWTDPATGQVYVHKDLVPQKPDWTSIEHISPLKADEAFADVDSWAEYIAGYGTKGHVLATWNSQGLRAILDYHHSTDEPDRTQWIARQPFALSTEWKAWTTFAAGQVHKQREAIEKLEEFGEDIVEPTETDLVLLLRNLRSNVTAAATTELREDGTTAVSWNQDKTVRGVAGTPVELPGVIKIAIPVLHGDVAKWEVKVRLRTSVDDQAHLGLRFSLMNAERVLEAVYAERVTQAKALLGDDYTLLRAAG